MNSTFDIFSIKTVPATYSWDKGTPVVTYTKFITDLSACKTPSSNDIGHEYVGYAPFMQVSLSSSPGSISKSFLALRRTADYGDYYNSDSNLVTFPTLSNELFCHVYVMPGLYSIRFERTEYIEAAAIDTLSPYGSATNVTYIQKIGKEENIPLSWQWYNFMCNSANPHNMSTTWLSAGFQQPSQLTWTETSGPCINLGQTEQILWKWDYITCVSDANEVTNAITWDETKSSVFGNTTWEHVSGNCSNSSAPVLSSSTQTAFKEAFIRVLEIPPTAYLKVLETGELTSPAIVTLSPRETICGSFPIEKIVWDLGDGSPLLVQQRWSNTLQEPFVFSGALSEDYQDPRNYDVKYTYTRTSGNFSFYPSITAYASSTNTSDCAATILGPIKLANTTGSNFKLLQNELTEHGKVLIGQVDNNVAVWRTDK